MPFPKALKRLSRRKKRKPRFKRNKKELDRYRLKSRERRLRDKENLRGNNLTAQASKDQILWRLLRSCVWSATVWSPMPSSLLSTRPKEMGGRCLISIASVMEEHQQWCSSSPPKTFVLVDLLVFLGQVPHQANGNGLKTENHLCSQWTLEN